MRLKWHNNQVCGNVALGHWAHTSVELLPYLWPRVKEGLAFLGQGDTFLEEACPLEFLIQGDPPGGPMGGLRRGSASITPGGGVPWPIGGGGSPRSGGYWVEAPVLAGAAATTVPLPCGVITC